MSSCNFCKSSSCGRFKGCTKCKVFWTCDSPFCVENCLEDHERACTYDIKSQGKPALRFSIGTEVVVVSRVSDISREGTVSTGFVIAIWPSDDQPYLVESIDPEKTLIPVTEDHVGYIIDAKYFKVENAQGVISAHMKFGLPPHLNLRHFRPEQLHVGALFSFFQAATFGNFYAIDGLVSSYGVDINACDENGRNILHLAIQSRMFSFVEFILTCEFPTNSIHQRLLLECDNQGKNILHYGVVCGHLKFFREVIVAGMKRHIKSDNVTDLFTQRDKSGRNALDYAVLLKKTELIPVLSQMTLMGSAKDFVKEYKDNSQQSEDQVYRNLQKHFKLSGITLDNAGIMEIWRPIFFRLFKHACNFGEVKVIRYFIEENTIQFAERLQHEEIPDSFSMDELINYAISECISGDLSWYITDSGLSHEDLMAYLHKSGEGIMTMLYDILRQWNINKMSIAAYISPKLELLTKNDSYLNCHMRGTFHSLFRDGVEKSHALLKYLLPKTTTNLYPSPYQFIVKNQPELLYMCYLKYPKQFDYFRPVTEDSTLMQLITENSYGAWYFMYDNNNKLISNMSICELLSIYCAMHDKYHEFVFLVKGMRESKLSIVNNFGFNFLQWAAMCGAYTCVKSCFREKLYKKENILENGAVNLIGRIVKAGHHHVAEYLVHKLGNKLSFRGDIKVIAKYYSLTRSVVLTKIWFKSAAKIQSLGRRYIVRKKLRFRFGLTFFEWKRYNNVWGAVVQQLIAIKQSSVVAVTWLDIKRQHDMVVSSSSEVEYDHELSAAIDQITDNVVTNLVVSHPAATLSSVSVTAPDSSIAQPCNSSDAPAELDPPERSVSKVDNIEVSSDVVKWINKTDSKYRAMFQNRIERLAEGDRSYALSKRLQHCAYPIYETKLDDGMRILWTVLRRENTTDCIMVWFVSKHDKVSHFAQRICDSCSRLSSSLTVNEGVESTSDASLLLGADDVLIDPRGNCPLKVHLTARNEIKTIDLSSGEKWSPPLKLSTKQQGVNDESGTVLLLGRSGTGKTICICERMIRDSHRHSPNHHHLQQLFVCRSQRLCAFVHEYQQKHCEPELFANMQFVTLSDFTERIAQQISEQCKCSDALSQYSIPANRVDFRWFLTSFHTTVAKYCGLPASILWLHIRSFLKGSVEAVMQGRPLTLEQYLDLSVFGMDRCRLSVEDRREVYAVFVRYEEALKTQGLWDDADYTLELLKLSKLQPLSTQYDKVYVDEVQDNTQAEIVLYFLAAGMNTQSLFLAGDPAQSVVEGVDFRFEDVRSIVYKLSCGKQSIHRPVKLTVNYRSHSGVLNCAAAVLFGLFAAFPASAKVLPKDSGLFHGPRPACCLVDGLTGLSELLINNQRWSVLCLDDQVDSVQSVLADHQIVNIVLGIRAAKGLEFQDVVLLDFFSNIPAADQPVWKTIFTSSNAALENIVNQHPEIELQLKLLYTAITRSCNRLIFVETKPSTLASVMFRWLTSQNITEMYLPSSESAVLMTSDEWRVQGIEFALSAEGDSTINFLQQAVKCFTQAKDSALADCAGAQLKLFQLQTRLLPKKSSAQAFTEIEEMDFATVLFNGLKFQQFNACKLVCGMLGDKVKHSILFKHEVLRPVNAL